MESGLGRRTWSTCKVSGVGFTVEGVGLAVKDSILGLGVWGRPVKFRPRFRCVGEGSGFLALPPSSQTILNLTYGVCGTNPSTFARRRDQAPRICKPK
jgi:hypothetical protein